MTVLSHSQSGLRSRPSADPSLDSVGTNGPGAAVPASELEGESGDQRGGVEQRRSDGTGGHELADMIQLYNDVTDRLKQSHELLRREVCRLREELEAKNEELARSERLAALGEMAAGVAHEIRNPLGGIRLYTSLLEKDLRDSPQALQLVKKVNAGVCTMESIVGDILAFSGDSAPNRRPVSLHEVVRAALIHADAHRIPLQAKIHFDDLDDPYDHGSMHQDGLAGTSRRTDCRNYRVHGDAGQLERAVLNLVLNALDAAGREGHVWIRCVCTKEKNERAMGAIFVEDSGPGISDDVARRMFNPFFTTKGSGTGLGLAIVHRIAEMHDGLVRIGSRADGGASISLHIPLIEDGL
ncbi:MAG: sensor histidine kinase [Phycisphaerae bacterium]